MGLDTSHECYHGGYSGFNLFRSELAQVAGIPLELMDGYYQDPLAPCKKLTRYWEMYNKEQPLPFWMEQAERALPIKWESLKPDVLHVLLNHSDCDGYIAWRHTRCLAKRLEELAPKLDERWGRIAIRVAEGLRLAHKRKERVLFG